MGFKESAKSLWGSFLMILNYITASFRRKKSTLFIGIFTVLIVVFFIGVLQNALKFSSVIFWNIAESQASQMDFTIVNTQGISFNESDPNSFRTLEKEFGRNKDIQGLAARVLIPGNCTKYPKNETNSKSCILFLQDTENEKKLGVGRNWKLPELNHSESYLTAGLCVFLKEEAEFQMQYYLTDSSQVLIGLADTFARLLEGTMFNPANHEENVGMIFTVMKEMRINYTVKNCFSDRKGKYPSMGDIVMAEKKHFMFDFSEALRETLANYESPDGSHPFASLADTASNNLKKFDLDPAWVQIVGQFKDRLEIYTQDSTKTSLTIKKKSDTIYNSLGVNSPLDIRMTTFAAMQALDLMRVFLDQMFTSTLIVLVGLGALLIYTLMLSDIEEKTYEYGMLRALGMSKKSFVALLSLTTEFFSIPGTIIGIGLSALIIWIAVLVVSKIIFYDINMFYQATAIILSIVLGLVLPLAANFFPIYQALGSTLRDSLDLYHQLNNDTQVTFTNLQTMGVSLTQTVMAIIVIAMGFMLFYGAPTAFFAGNIASFLFILIWMLIAMLVGLVFIAIFFEPFLERFFVFFLVGILGNIWCGFCRDRRFRGLVRKSLSSHRSRNRKTAIMFTGTLAFIIFAGSEFSLQSKQIGDQIRVGGGADLVFSAPGHTGDQYIQKDKLIDAYKIAKEQFPDVVGGMTYRTYPLTAFQQISRVRIGNFNGLDSTTVSAFAVDRNYMEGCFSEFYMVGDTRKGGSFENVPGTRLPDVIKNLWDYPKNITLPIETTATRVSIITGRTTNASVIPFPKFIKKDSTKVYEEYIDCVVGVGLLTSTNTEMDTPLRLDVGIRTGVASALNIPYLGKVRATIKRIPGMSFGGFASSASGSSLPLTDTQYKQMLGEALCSVQYNDGHTDFSSADCLDTPNLIKNAPYPIQSALVLLKKSDTTIMERNKVIDSLRTDMHPDISVTDAQEVISTVQATIQVLNIFFYIFGSISIILCFFVLNISFTANVRENSWEFGVLRSLGLTGWQTIRIYIYEALSLVLSCIVFGTIIGIGVAITLTLQFLMFSELPFVYIFPTVLFVIAVGLSLIVAVFGSTLASYDMKQKDIASVIRSGS